MQQTEERKESQGADLKIQMRSLQQNQHRIFSQHFKTGITNQIKDENNQLGQKVRQEIIKRAALSFVEEMRGLIKGSKGQTLKMPTQPFLEQSDQSSEGNSHSSRQEFIHRIICSDSDDSEQQCSIDCSDFQSSNQSSQYSVYTFQGAQSQYQSILLQQQSQKRQNLQDILLESGEGQQLTNKQKPRFPSQIRKAGKLRKKLKNKVCLGKNSFGPKFNSLFYSKQQKLSKKEETDSKGVRKLQKMIDKLQLNQNNNKKQKQPESSSDEALSGSEKEESGQQEYYEDSFLDSQDLQDLQALNLDNNEGKKTDKEQLISNGINSGAIKKVKIEESQDYQKKPIYINVQINVVSILQSLVKQNQSKIQTLKKRIETARQVQKDNESNEDRNFYRQEK